MEKSKSTFRNDFEDLMNIYELFEIKKNEKKNNEDEFNGFTIINMNNKKNKSVNEINEVVRTSTTFLPNNSFSLLSSIKSFTSTIYYNHLINNPKLDFKNINEPFIIFNQQFNKSNLINIKNQLYTFLYMSYRNNFYNLKGIGSGNYTNDCGWGCMLRASQMMLSKALIERKIYKNKILEFNKNIYNNIRKEVLIGFLDDYISIDIIICHNDYNYFWEQYKKLCQIDKKYLSLTQVIPPYSIQMICKLGKCAGKFNSDVSMIKILMKINEEMFNDINMIHFECGTLIKDKIFKSCCIELLCNCEDNNFSILDENINIDKKNSMCDNCLKDYLEKNKLTNDDILIDNDKKYIFKKGCIIFISFRLGIKKIHPDNIETIPNLFLKLHNNIGFISGKENKAFYFIGLNGKQLMYIDPHLNQPSIKGNLNDISSYEVKDIFIIDIKDISSELSTGVLINNITDLKTFFTDINWFISNYPYFIKYDNIKNSIPQNNPLFN